MSAMLRPRQKQQLDSAILLYLQKNYPTTSQAFQQELSAPLSSESEREKDVLITRWLATARLQVKVGELEEQLNAATLKLQIVDKATKQFKPIDEDSIPRSPPLHVLSGHRKEVTKVAFNPVYLIIASSSEDGSIIIWDYSGDCQLERTLKSHTGAVNDIAFDCRGEWLVSCSTDTSIKLWDCKTFECVRTFNGHSQLVSSVAFYGLHPSDTSSSYNNSNSGSKYVKNGHHVSNEGGARASDNGVLVTAVESDRILSCCKDRTLKLWDTSNGFCLKTFSGHSDWVRCLSQCPQLPHLFASGSHDKTINIWDFNNASPLHDLVGHSHVIEQVLFVSTECLTNLLEQKKAPPPVPSEFLPDTLQHSDRPRLRSTISSRMSEPDFQAVNQALEDVCVPITSKSGVVLFSCSRDITIKMWDPLNRTCLLTMEGHTNWVKDICLHSRGHILISCSDDRSMRMWDVATGASIGVIESAHAQFLTCVAFSSKSGLVASGSLDRVINLWECKGGKG